MSLTLTKSKDKSIEKEAKIITRRLEALTKTGISLQLALTLLIELEDLEEIAPRLGSYLLEHKNEDIKEKFLEWEHFSDFYKLFFKKELIQSDTSRSLNEILSVAEYEEQLLKKVK